MGYPSGTTSRLGGQRDAIDTRLHPRGPGHEDLRLRRLDTRAGRLGWIKADIQVHMWTDEKHKSKVWRASSCEEAQQDLRSIVNRLDPHRARWSNLIAFLQWWQDKGRRRPQGRNDDDDEPESP